MHNTPLPPDEGSDSDEGAAPTPVEEPADGPPPGPGKRKGRPASAPDEQDEPEKDVELALKAIHAVSEGTWCDKDGRGFISLRFGSDIGVIHVPLDGLDFRYYVVEQVYAQYERVISRSTVEQAAFFVSALAARKGPTHTPFVRVGHEDGRVFVNLNDPKGWVVEITAAGYTVKKSTDVPVRFVSYSGALHLPVPTQQEDGSPLLLLKSLLNLSDENFVLLVGFLLGCFNGGQSYPHLALQGRQGSGKSTASRLIGELVDPSSTPLQTEPQNEQDLVIAASRSFLLTFDNLSGLPSWLSDSLCRFSTGGSLRTRKLYSGRDEERFDVTRPVVLNGIDEIATQNDLADRTILLRLPSIGGGQRKTREEIDGAFRKALPDLLGAMYASVSTALRNLPDVELEEKPRMADFARWGVAAEPALPVAPGAFLEAYLGHIQSTAESNVEGDPVSAAVAELMESRDEWTGSISALKALLVAGGDPHGLKRMSNIKLRNDLYRAAPALERVGVYVEELGHHPRTRLRMHRITRPKRE